MTIHLNFFDYGGQCHNKLNNFEIIKFQITPYTKLQPNSDKED